MKYVQKTIAWEQGHAPFGRRACDVVAVEDHGRYRVIWIDDPTSPIPTPGQFYMLASKLQWGGEHGRPYLARAFSVLRADATQRAFLLDNVGPGTDRLCAVKPSEELWVMGPFGNGFSLPTDKNVVLVGGGVGVAPLLILSDYLSAEEIPHNVYLGFQNKSYTQICQLFHDSVTLQVATEDGSIGAVGRVTDLLLNDLQQDKSTTLYSCGPPGMLAAVQTLCEVHSISGQLALEAPMACGFGSCHGCVIEQADGQFVRVCIDGPVFSTASLTQKTFVE